GHHESGPENRAAAGVSGRARNAGDDGVLRAVGDGRAEGGRCGGDVGGGGSGGKGGGGGHQDERGSWRGKVWEGAEKQTRLGMAAEVQVREGGPGIRRGD